MLILSSDLRNLPLITILIFILACPVTALQKQPETFEYFFNQGIELYRAKNYDDAVRYLKRALKKKADSAEAKFYLSMAYRGKHQPDDALRFAKEAVTLQPQYPDAHFVLAVLLYESFKAEDAIFKIEKREKFNQAWQSLQTAISQGSKAASLYEFKGLMECDEHKFEAALESYKEALRLSTPQHPERNKLQEKVEQITRYLEVKKLNPSVVDQRPRPLSFPRPDYTEKARQEKVQGHVAVYAKVDEQGKVAECFPILTLGFGLDEEAVQTVKSMKFKPAIKDNQAVVYWVMLEVEFRLR
jgi:TonB family protein